MVLYNKISAYIIALQDKIDTFKKGDGEIEEDLVISHCPYS